MTALGMLLAGIGLVLIYAGIRGEDIRAVLLDTFTRKAKT